MPTPQRFPSKPPNINLSLARQKRHTNVELETESPVDLSSDEDDVFEDTLQLSSRESSPTTPPSIPTLKLEISDDESNSDDISKDLAELKLLRQSVKQNLRLRPIRSFGALPKVDVGPIANLPRKGSFSNPSSALQSPESGYCTPLTSYQSPTPVPKFDASLRLPRPIEPDALHERLTSSRRPLILDARAPTSYLSCHVRNSINVAIPSLILKRCRKPGGGFQSLEALRQFITTDGSKASWDEMLAPGGPWDGDILVYDDEMNLKEKDNIGASAWALIPVLAPLIPAGRVDYMKGGFSAAGRHPEFETLIVSGGEYNFGFNVDSPPPQTGGGGLKRNGGLFQLDTQAAFNSKPLPEIELSSAISVQPSSPHLIPPSIMSAPVPVSSSPQNNDTLHPDTRIIDPSPSPPPSTFCFVRPPGPHRRPSVPMLRRLDTKSAERLNVPALSIRTRPLRSATSPSFQSPTSPAHLNLMYSNHSPPPSARYTPSGSPSYDTILTAYYTPPHTPLTPKPPLPPSPSTAKPDLDDPPTTDEAYPVFTISTILPNFLYLGPELTSQDHVEELQSLGVKRILNLAAECEDDQGLNLKQVFKYYKIPMRDIVEEENITRGVKEVCEILDDARLHSAPTYVHCKVGKSRSVTAVMAYLIHANHWTLSRAYAFVLERRKGISPNIGFVSELMNFEEQELGGKSIGVHPSVPAGGNQHDHVPDSYAAAASGGHVHGHLRRSGHVRESLPPPALSAIESSDGTGALSSSGLKERVGDSGQDMEIKDAEGRYRHARRAPVDETTLQPMRRVSKAGLESSTHP